jgi:hypothetical protein
VHVLDWSRERLAAAMATLAITLAGHPLRLAVTEDDLVLTLSPGVLPDELHHRLHGARVARAPPTPNQARQILGVIRETILRPVTPAQTLPDSLPAGILPNYDATTLTLRGLGIPDQSPPPQARGWRSLIAHPDTLFALGLSATPAATSFTAPPPGG